MSAIPTNTALVDEVSTSARPVVASAREWRMKTSIDHLPEYKRAQLRAITAIFAEPREGNPVAMLILFGSHARGDWVDDRETGYKSDYDLLVVVANEKQVADVMLWGELEQRAREVAGQIPVTVIVHDINFLNHEIRVGQFFFSDIAAEGVLLFDSRRFTVAKPKALNNEERLEQGEYNFRSWFGSATEFWRLSRYATVRDIRKHAAFLLHQATERYYHTAILIFTGYKERSHDIEKLGKLAAEQHPLLVDILPKIESEDKRLFDLLKKAYIEARYSGSYRITQEELSNLQARVVVLAERVRAACLEKIATFCGPEAMRTDHPLAPQMSEPPLANPPSMPEDPKGFAQWAHNLAELSEQRGETKGRTEGRAEGKNEGRTEGLRDGKAEALLLVLRARGAEISPELEYRIRSCSDPATLTRWLQRAATVARTEDVLAE